MTVLDVLKSFTTYLNNQDDFTHYLSNDENNATTEEQSNFKKFLLSLNFTLKYIYGKVFNVSYLQSFTPDSEGKILFSSFSKKINSIKKVKIAGSFKNVRFKVFDSFLICDTTENVNVIYSYFLDDLTSTSNDVSLNGISDKTFVLGVIKEYLFICKIFDDAEIFNEKFESELKIEKDKLKNIVLPKRNWGI